MMKLLLCFLFDFGAVLKHTTARATLSHQPSHIHGNSLSAETPAPASTTPDVETTNARRADNALPEMLSLIHI